MFFEVCPNNWAARERICEKTVNVSYVHKVRLNFDCVDGSIVNDMIEQFLTDCNSSGQPSFYFWEEPSVIPYNKTKEGKLDFTLIYLKDDDYKTVDSKMKLQHSIEYEWLIPIRVKTFSHCVGGKPNSATSIVTGDNSFKKRIEMEMVVCRRMCTLFQK